MNRTKVSLVWLSSMVGFAWPALAEMPAPSLQLAPPGPCAVPRNPDLQVDPVYSTAAAQQAAEEDFQVAGSPTDHFDPIDVAAPSPDGEFSPPIPPEIGRGSCASPDAGCGDLLTAGLIEARIVESAAQVGAVPGTNP